MPDAPFQGRAGRAGGLSALFFPPEPRSFPARRGLKVLFRAAHVLSAGILTGAYVLDAGAPLRTPWLVWAIASGALILLLDLYESAVFLLQVRGLVVIGKIGLLLALPLFERHAAWVLAALVVVSVVFSHAPGKIRYHVILGGDRFKGAETRG